MEDVDVEANRCKLGGNILGPVPLVVEDKQHQLVNKTWLYLHTSKAEYNPSDDPGIVNISVAAVYELGAFHSTITSKVGENIFRDLPALNIDNWYQIISNLFPIDDINNLEIGDIDQEIIDRYQLSGKLLVASDSQGDYLDETLTISIKTKDTIPITIGSFDLQPVDFKEEPRLNEGNLFDWLQLVTQQNNSMKSTMTQLNQKVDSLELEIYKLKNGLETSKSDYEMIIKDLETKFYQVLNSKKDYIWYLLNEKNPSSNKNEIKGLNSHYMNHQGKLNNIDPSKIPDVLDTKFIKARKKAPVKLNAKRRKKTETVEDSQDTPNDETGDINVKQEDSQDGDNSLQLKISLELKDDSSVDSNKFAFTRSFGRSYREIADKELYEGENDKNDDENDQEDEDDERDEDYDGQSDNKDAADRAALPDSQEDDDVDYNDDKDNEEVINPSKNMAAKSVERTTKEEEVSLLPSSHEVIEDSLPDREKKQNQHIQEQETDYESEMEGDVSIKQEQDTLSGDKISIKQSISLQTKHDGDAIPIEEDLEASEKENTMNEAGFTKLDKDQASTQLQSQIETDYEDSDD